MLRDNLMGLIEPMRISAGADPLALSLQKQGSDDRPSCLENPRPDGTESSLTENVNSPFQAEPAQGQVVTLIIALNYNREFSFGFHRQFLVEVIVTRPQARTARLDLTETSRSSQQPTFLPDCSHPSCLS